MKISKSTFKSQLNSTTQKMFYRIPFVARQQFLHVRSTINHIKKNELKTNRIATPFEQTLNKRQTSLHKPIKRSVGCWYEVTKRKFVNNTWKNLPWFAHQQPFNEINGRVRTLIEFFTIKVVITLSDV